MKNEAKFWMILICLLGIFAGRIFNRVLSNYFGNNGSNIAISISLTIVLCGIVMLFIKGYNRVAIVSSVFLVPLVVGGIGLYSNNMDVVGLSIVLFFIILFILIMLIPKYLKNHK